MMHTDMMHTDMMHTDMMHTDMMHTDMMHTDMMHTDMKHTDMKHTDMKHTDMMHTDMMDTDMMHINRSDYQNMHRREGVSTRECKDEGWRGLLTRDHPRILIGSRLSPAVRLHYRSASPGSGSTSSGCGGPCALVAHYRREEF